MVKNLKLNTVDGFTSKKKQKKKTTTTTTTKQQRKRQKYLFFPQHQHPTGSFRLTKERYSYAIKKITLTKDNDNDGHSKDHNWTIVIVQLGLFLDTSNYGKFYTDIQIILTLTYPKFSKL